MAAITASQSTASGVTIAPQIPDTIQDFLEALFPDQAIQTKTIKGGVEYAIPNTGISVSTDKFKALHINVTELHDDLYGPFAKASSDLHAASALEYDAVWFNFKHSWEASPLRSLLQSTLPQNLREIRDLQRDEWRFAFWLNLNIECPIPLGATHNMGAAAVVVDFIAKKILLVETRTRLRTLAFPGGSFDPKDKTLFHTAWREADEETGLGIPLPLEKMQLGETHFPDNQFAAAVSTAWLFPANDLSIHPLAPPVNEIARAIWVDFQTILDKESVDLSNSDGTASKLNFSKEIRPLLQAAINGSYWSAAVDKPYMTVFTAVPSTADVIVVPGPVKSTDVPIGNT